MACVIAAPPPPYRAVCVILFNVIHRMGRAPTQHEVECATKFRMALMVAFGKSPFATVMVSGIVAWRRAFANLRGRAIPVRADRPAVLAALKCHDLAGQDTIAVEPCTGGYRLVRRPYPEKLLSLHA